MHLVSVQKMSMHIVRPAKYYQLDGSVADSPVVTYSNLGTLTIHETKHSNKSVLLTHKYQKDFSL